MVISDKNRYVFIEVPRTGSTAISRELREKYDGYEILHKHANYKDFYRNATPEQKKYFVFAGVRNPLDDTASLYSKFLVNHKNQFTSPKLRLENGGWVSRKRLKMYEFVQKHKDFGKYLDKYHKLTYTSNANVNKNHCDMFIRFECIDDDLEQALNAVGLRKKRKLPVVNKTGNKKNYAKYFDEQTPKKIVRTFGPFMHEWGYKLPNNLDNISYNKIDVVRYEVLKFARKIYMNYIKSGPLERLTFLRNRIE